ncbi:unnamed protein product [Cunninghamella echinulata]
MKLSVIFLVILISVVSAQQPAVTITYPKNGAILKAGTNAMITWNNPTVDFVNGIVLGKGTATDVQPIEKIAGMIPAFELSYTWKIPANFSSGNDYFFIFGQTANQAIAGPFTISSDSTSNTNNSTTGSNPPSSSINNGSSNTSPDSNKGIEVSINNSNNGGLSGGIIAAIVIPVVVLALVIIAIFLFFYKKREKKNELPGDTFVLDKSDPRLNLNQTDFSSIHTSKSDKQTINNEEEKINKVHDDDYSTDTYCKLFENTTDKNSQNVEYIKPSARY